MQELLDLGVTIYENYEFDHWDTCTFDEIAEKTHFKSTVEDQPEHLTLKSFALFCYRYKRVDDVIVSGKQYMGSGEFILAWEFVS